MSLHQRSATKIVADLNAGKIRATQVVKHQLGRIAHLNPKVNAVVATNVPPPGNSWGKLAGLPITLKDQIHFPSLACTFGSEAYRDFYPVQTAPVVENLLQAGAQVIGKTNLPPFAMDFQCSSPLFGTTNNPWDFAYTSGGSSGGGTAAVAAGLSFVDIGTDLSGSLRIPASFCGVLACCPQNMPCPLKA
ncbi:amidase [Pseudophaeobacter sp.]|uniref:amidase n=1 Tax=Pseudophaeobacter sp. TaxID=1971739 RepID=UPI00329953C7